MMGEKLFTDFELQLLGEPHPNKNVCKIRSNWLRKTVAIGQSKDDIFLRIDKYYEDRTERIYPVALRSINQYKGELSRAVNCGQVNVEKI
jgi:hypothetical protein